MDTPVIKSVARHWYDALEALEVLHRCYMGDMLLLQDQ